MDEEDENVGHAASYQIQKTQKFEPTEQFARDRFSKIDLLCGETNEDLDVLADLQREGKLPPDPHLDVLLANYRPDKAALRQYELVCDEAQ